MRLTTRLKLFIGGWLLLEFLAFIAVAKVVGIGGALLAGLLTTLFGASLLRREGAAAMIRLRASLSGRRGGDTAGVLDGTVSAFAAAALLLPGFLSDALGLALAVPPVRAAVVRWLDGGGLRRRFGDAGVRHGPEIIDLDPQEWSHAQASSPRERLRGGVMKPGSGSGTP